MRIKQHSTSWQGPEEEMDASMIEASNRVRDQIGNEIFSLEAEMIRSYRTWEDSPDEDV